MITTENLANRKLHQFSRRATQFTET